MTTYRTGNHWGVTIVREGGKPCTDDPEHLGQSECAELVAVVVNGDQDLAERICALLNGDQQPGGLLTQWVRDMSDGDFETLKAQFLASVGQSRKLTVLPPAPDVDHARGAADALAHVRHLLNQAAEPDERLFAATVAAMLDRAAAELGIEETEGRS